MLASVFTEDVIPHHSNRMELSSSQQAQCSLLSEGWSARELSAGWTSIQGLLLTCSLLDDRSCCQRNGFQVKGFLGGLQGVLVQSPLQARNGHCQPCRQNPKVTKTTASASSVSPVKPGKRYSFVLRRSCITIQDVPSIEGFLLLLQNIQVEGSSVSHFVVIIHHTPEGKWKSSFSARQQSPHE